MGLGDLTVNSYLDQPFNAEIELIDVGNVPLSGIKANLASVEDFERVGLDQVYALGSLTFTVQKKSNGKTVIQINSVDRISEPFMPLLVDLAWADGQVYRSYTILLDPPNYPLSSDKKHLQNALKRHVGSNVSSRQEGEIDRPIYSQVERESTSAISDTRGVVSYGPTSVNETIWQIAQRHKIDQVLLQQMILAIVGTNPQAFTEGNLNGLKVGSHLKIPTNTSASKVPAELSEIEVLAHDKAWQSRHAIEHALLPPYIETTTSLSVKELGASSLISTIASVPVFEHESSEEEANYSHVLSLRSSILSLKEAGQTLTPGGGQQPGFKAEMDIIASAINSVRDANAVLGVQLRAMRKDNKQLQQQLAVRDLELKKLRQKIHFLMLGGKGIHGDVKRPLLHEEGHSSWSLVLLLLALGAGGGFVYWRYWLRAREEKPTPPSGVSGYPTLETVVPPSFETELTSPTEQERDILVSEPNLSKKEEKELFVSEPTLPVPEEEPPVDKFSALTAEEPAEWQATLPKDEEQVIPPTPVFVEKEDVIPPTEELSKDEHVLEFETGIQEMIEDSPEVKPEPKVKRKSKGAQEKDQSIDFVLNPVELPPEEVVSKPAKSKVALETLLALAKTYIGMDDVEAAQQSLQEVIDHGSEEQQVEAQRMLDELKKK